MKTTRKEKTTVTLELADLGRWPVEIESGILRRLHEQAVADGEFVLADSSAAKNFGRYLQDALTAMIRREFAPPTPAQVKFARRIAELLELEISDETMESKMLISAFIGDNKDAFDEVEARAFEARGATGPRRIR